MKTTGAADDRKTLGTTDDMRAVGTAGDLQAAEKLDGMKALGTTGDLQAARYGLLQGMERMDSMAHSYRMQGTCATEVTFDLEEGLLRNVQFRGGCDGNLKAVMVLLEGRSAREAKALLAGIRCGRKRTSCPDQLSKALANACPEED